VTDPEQPQRVVYWSPEDGLHDLATLLDASASGVTFNHVLDINNAGQVLVSREGSERWVDYLLTPVPEPGGATATLVALAFAATRRRVRRGLHAGDPTVMTEVRVKPSAHPFPLLHDVRSRP
jgi:hypothetical protein